MRIRSIDITNFKGIAKLKHDFTDQYTGEPRDITAVFGENASGKTSLLQAIALVLSIATRKISGVDEFSWHGFLPDRVNSLGDTRVELQVELTPEEINTVKEIFDLWKQYKISDDRKLATPKQDRVIRLVYQNGKVTCSGGLAQNVELWARYYTSGLVKKERKYLSYFEKVGDVFWFDQYRNLGSGLVEAEANKELAEKISWQAGVEGLRKYLVGWWNYHQYSKDRSEDDFINRLQIPFSRVFLDTTFDGLEPMPEDNESSIPPEFYFMLRHDERRYDISEMSSGEQAVFSVMYEFVRQRIAHSIVLIDELELHLHPPQQQTLYNSLRKIGSNCQFIITSHSPFLEDVIPDEDKLRLRNGQVLM